EWTDGIGPSERRGRPDRVISPIMGAGSFKPAAPHSSSDSDHSPGETNWSLPSGYALLGDRRSVSNTLNVGELLNLVGLSTGVVLYAMLLAMVVRAGPTPGLKSRFDPLLLLTSVLGLVWNLCALPAYELPKVGIEGPFPYLAAIGFGALGFLPAVVVHSVLRGERHAVRGALKRWLAAVAYGVSAIAAALH